MESGAHQRLLDHGSGRTDSTSNSLVHLLPRRTTISAPQRTVIPAALTLLQDGRPLDSLFCRMWALRPKPLPAKFPFQAPSTRKVCSLSFRRPETQACRLQRVGGIATLTKALAHHVSDPWLRMQVHTVPTHTLPPLKSSLAPAWPAPDSLA